MADVLAYAELRDGDLRPVAREVVTASRTLADQLGGEVHAMAVGGSGAADAAADLARYGADRVLVVEEDALALYQPEANVEAVALAVADISPAAVLFPASALGKDLAARVAARLDRALATEVTGIEVDGTAPVVTRPMYGGKAYGRFRFAEAPALLSIRPNVFAPTECLRQGEVRLLEAASLPTTARTLALEKSERQALDVREAGIVVSGGRGMQDPENWHLLEDLVSALGDDATLGASRAVVDAGWRPHSEQVGQTGKVVSPTLYFAVGISGAIQHLAGMRTAGVIVAVNKDPEAPIFAIADYGIVGDLFDILPRLASELRGAE